LSLNPKPNNGTLRLPLKPVGFHGPETTTSEPLDPVDPIATADPSTDTISISPIEASSGADPNVVPPSFVGVHQPDDADDKAATEDDSNATSDEEEKGGGFWDYLFGKLDGFKEWLEGLADSGRDPG
jgi:hypothetical protein